MIGIELTTVDGLDPAEGRAIARRLCRAGSEFQSEVVRVLSGDASSATPIALWHEDGAVIGWAASHVWQGMQTLEQFTDERHRGRGIASALSAALLARGVLDRTQEVAVFSPTTQRLAARLGMQPVRYMRDGDRWVVA